MNRAGEAIIIQFPMDRIRRTEEPSPLLELVETPVPALLETNPGHTPVAQQPDEAGKATNYVPENERLCHKRPGYFTEPEREKLKERVARFIKARAFCNLCEVKDECLQGAIDRREPSGVWGGEEFFGGKINTGRSKNGNPMAGFPKL